MERLAAIEHWFRDQKQTLRYERLPDDEWVALWIPDHQTTGITEGVRGTTKRQAAKNATNKYAKKYGLEPLA